MLELAHERLYWPEPSQVLHPSGSGPQVYARLAREKIGKKIERDFPEDATGVEVSVLTANPEGDDTEAPIAIVCQFNRPISQELVIETHKLAWSFSRARSLITIEPQLLRVWSCCEPPQKDQAPDPIVEVEEADLNRRAADALQWVELVSGNFFCENEDRFQRSGAADQLLLKNLQKLREYLQEDGLDDETIHDLLARIIFIQFLFQKQDSSGTPALNERILQKLYVQGYLSKQYKEFPEILENFNDTYKLFRWLNNKFNGDFFPGKGETEEEREAEWQAEIQKVWTDDNRYLVKLAEFVRGDLDLQSGQLSLWPYYSFDVIPLEFISSIYEEFVNKKLGSGVHYTPEYIVDFILDGVLPWNEKEWNLKILDPACGSGIFLVKTFQRLIHRWKLANGSEKVPAHILRTLLESNIFGIDIDKEAVRVASFSLYLTMLDGLDPLEYWEDEVRFPKLRNKQLIHSDFFQEDAGILKEIGRDLKDFDLIIGNAPWGEKTATEVSRSWAKVNDWPVADDNIGPLFLAKSISLSKVGGHISLVQPATTVLSSDSKSANKFRRKLFEVLEVQEIVNLSPLRFKVFPNAVSPSCIISGVRSSSERQPFYYICPKATETEEDVYRVIIDPHDINLVYPNEAIHSPNIWVALMWGNRRDLDLVSRLSKNSNLEYLESQNLAISTLGIQRGNKNEQEKYFCPSLLNRKILEISDFPKDSLLHVAADSLKDNENPYAERGRRENFEAFNAPQILIKRSWTKKHGRFIAKITRTSSDKGIVCTKAYVSVHLKFSEATSTLKLACLTYNSKLAVYYLLLSSGRFAFYRPEPDVNDLLRVPIPQNNLELTEELENLDEIDNFVYKSFYLNESEKVLIEDLCEYTLPDYQGNASSPGRQKTHRITGNSLKTQEEPELRDYCEYFMRVLTAGFGKDKGICATLFQEATDKFLPVRLVAIHLDKSIHERIKIEPITSQSLLKRLNQLNDLLIRKDGSFAGGVFYQRVARIYDSYLWNGEQVPAIYIVKPDKIRYWTRSMALRDADEVAADIMRGRLNMKLVSEAVPQ